jgi:hypothetical protein
MGLRQKGSQLIREQQNAGNTAFTAKLNVPCLRGNRSGGALVERFGNICSTFLLGVALMLAYRRLGALWPLVLAHYFMDIAAFA